MTKMGGIKKKNNTLSGVFFGFRLTDLPSTILQHKRFFCREGEKAFLEFKAGSVFASQKWDATDAPFLFANEIVYSYAKSSQS
jgi:hypothetical protein